MLDITRPAPHTTVGYPPLPACLPKPLGTREDPQRKDDSDINHDQPAKGYNGYTYARTHLELNIFK